VKNCQGSNRVYTIKSQYTHHLSLANDVPTHPQKKKKVLSLAFGVCEKNKTHTHTSCGKKECLFTHHSLDG
jgi:hypothetical protein